MPARMAASGDVTFDGPSHFLDEYERSIQSGSLEIRAPFALEPGQRFRLRLLLPTTGEALAVGAEVVGARGSAVALTLLLPEGAAMRLAHEASACGHRVTMEVPSVGRAAMPPRAPDPGGGTQPVPPLRDPEAGAPPAAPPRTVDGYPRVTPPPGRTESMPPLRPTAPMPGMPRPTQQIATAAQQAPTVPAFSGRIARPFGADDVVAGIGDSPVHEGDLLATTFARLARYLGQSRATGRLHVERMGQQKQVTLIGGLVVAAAADPPRAEEEIVPILIGLKRMNRLQEREALERVRRDGKPIERVLIEMTILKRDEIRTVLGQQTKVRVADLFEWPDARYRFEPVPISPQEVRAHPVRLGSLVAERARRHFSHMTIQDLDASFGDDVHRFVRLRGGPEALARYVPDMKEAAVLAQLLDGARRVREVIAASVLGRTATLRLLGLLRTADLLEFATAQAAQATPEELDADLREQAAALAKQNPFEQLGLHYTVAAAAVEPAHRKKLGEIGAHRSTDAAAKQRARELLGEAARALGNPETRRRLRKDVAGPDRAEFAAKLLLDQAEMLALRRTGQAAIAEMLDVVDELGAPVMTAPLRRRLAHGRGGM